MTTEVEGLEVATVGALGCFLLQFPAKLFASFPAGQFCFPFAVESRFVPVDC